MSKSRHNKKHIDEEPITAAQFDRIDADLLAASGNYGGIADDAFSDASQSQSQSQSQSELINRDVDNSNLPRRIHDVSMVMRAPKYDYEQVADYKSVPYVNLDWFDINQEDRDNEELRPHWNRCQLCELDQTKKERENWPALEDLKSAGDKYYHQMEPIALAKLMRRMYDTNIRPGVDGEIPMRTEMFWIHIDRHAPTIMHQVEDSLRNMTDMIRVIRDGEVYEQHSGTKHMRVSKGPAMMMLKIEKERKYYLKVVMEMRAARET